GLVYSMSMIYYSLVTVPAWHSWFVPLQFFATTVILGSLAIGTAFVITTSVQARQVARGVTASAADSGRRVSLRQRFTTPADPAVRDEVEALLAVSVRGIVVTAFVASAALLVAIPLYLSGLTAIGGVALQSVEVYSGALFVARLGLLALGAGLLAVFTYFIAAKPRENLGRLVVVLTTSLVLVFIAEVLGRALFYESMFRVGV
ncbi:MAG: DmsC/YnfH family molybdoenzyme membrane anchor subunit, partial [Brooklawnia sp.]